MKEEIDSVFLENAGGLFREPPQEQTCAHGVFCVNHRKGESCLHGYIPGDEHPLALTQLERFILKVRAWWRG